MGVYLLIFPSLSLPFFFWIWNCFHNNNKKAKKPATIIFFFKAAASTGASWEIAGAGGSH